VIIGGAPNYYPNSFSGPVDHTKYLEHTYNVSGDVARYNTADDDNFTQVGTFWKKVGLLLLVQAIVLT
jgi:catalase